MSGNAALSAARKRRASSSPSVAGGMPSSQQPSGSYYTGNNIQHIQTMMNQSIAGKPPRGAPSSSSSSSSSSSLDTPQQIPINVYENIELIKQQIEQRTKLIQTQGSTMPPEKVKILHKQNEVQIQILKQRMLMVQEMEMAASIQSPKTTTSPVQMAPHQASSNSEPQFIYEKGIPRPNPNYNNGNSSNDNHISFNTSTVNVPQQRNTVAQSSRNLPTAILTPFVSMITSTGATPPPLVILKSHDEKIGEHDAVLNDLANRINYIHSQVDELSQNNSSNARGHAHARDAAPAADAHAHAADEDADADADADANEPGDETELLMETVMNDLINSRDFVQGIVDKIVNETNLSETILKVEPIIKENQELRSLIHSQQQMLNEMNTMVMRLLNQHQRQHYDDNSAGDSIEDIVETTNQATEAQNDENGFDENGLYHQQQPSTVIADIPLHGFLVPDMENADMSICFVNDNVNHEDQLSVLMDAAIDAAVDAAIGDDEPEAEHDHAHDHDHDHDDHNDDADYTTEAPHFPSDSRIALVINEI